MSKLRIKSYELRDVAVMQAPVSFCNHRGDVNPFIEVCNREVYPIFVAPMASVTNQHNYKVWIENKLTPVIPRSVQKSENNPNGLTFEERMELAKETFVSVSLKEAQNELLMYLAGCYYDEEIKDFAYSTRKFAENPVYYICIDIAHGTLSELYDTCKKLKSQYGEQIIIMTGNVANPSAYSCYADAGIDWMRATIGSGCFTPDMCVITKDCLKKICEIQIGDEVLTHTGEFHKVTHVHEYQKNEKLIRINDIECTTNHLFYVVNQKDFQNLRNQDVSKYAYWVPSNEIDKEKHYLIKKDGETRLCVIENIEYFDYNGKVYDLTVDTDETYNINGIIVHNSRCTSSANVSIHYGTATLLDQLNEERKAYSHSHNGNAPTKIIADGGIGWFDDIQKALALGADAVMCGKIFAECEEACEEIYWAGSLEEAKDKTKRRYDTHNENELNLSGVNVQVNEFGTNSLEELKLYMKPYIPFRDYYGMSTKRAQKQISDDKTKLKTSEGIDKPVEVKYPVAEWVDNMQSYLRSCMTYTNSKTIQELRENAQVVILGGSGDLAYRK